MEFSKQYEHIQNKIHDVIHRVMPTICQNHTCKLLVYCLGRRSSHHHTNVRCVKKITKTFLKEAVSKNINKEITDFTKTYIMLFSIGGVEQIPYYKILFSVIV